MIALDKKFILNDNSGSYFEIFLVISLMLIAVKTTFSQTTWNGSSSTDWNTAANWSTNSVPTSSDDVIIPNVTNDPIITSSSDVCQNLTIQSGGVLTSNNGSYKLTTASITVNDGGSLVISNGEVESSGDADFSGDLTMSGGLLDVDGEFDMLSTGDGRNISDGNITAKQGRFNYAEFFQPSGGTFTFDVGYNGILSMHSSSHFHNLAIDIGASYSLSTLANFDVNGTLTLTSGSLDISSYTVTVSGETDNKGTLIISTGIFDANGAYKGGGGGAISFTDAGFLKCSASVYSLGSMNSNIGTVVFDKTSGTQNVRPDTYYNLTIDGNATHQIGSSSINVLGNFVVNQNGSTVFDTRDLNITVSGTSDINGTLDIGTGTFDANGTFDATGGSVTFTDAGQLNLAGTVTSLGTFTRSTGTVQYDGGDQSVIALSSSSSSSYNNLIINGTGTKTLAGTSKIYGDLTLTASDFDINGKTIYLKENMTRTSGNLISGSSANITIDNSGSHNICAFSDDDITIKTTSTGGSVTTTGDISCKSIDLTSGSKTFLIDGETVNLDEDLVVTAGTFQMTSGVLNINSNSSTSAVVEGGTLDLDGGTLTVGNSTTGDLTLTSGLIDVSGGTLNIADELDVSDGTITQSGGTINIKSYVGSANGSSSAKFEMDAGTLNLTGGTLRLNGQTTTSASSNPAMKIASGVSVIATSSHITLIQSNNTTGDDEDIYIDMDGNDLGALTVNLTGHEVILNSNVTLNGDLTFTSEDIVTGANTLTLSTTSSVSGADDSKHLNGTCAKTTSSTSSFTFPVGDGTRYRPITLTPAASNSNIYSVKYNHSPHSDVSISGSSSIDHISPQYHWDINRTSGSDNATISVAWTASSTYGTENWNHDISTMLWAYFDGTDWNSIGSTPSGSSVSGSLTTSSANTNWSNENFTLAATTATYPPLPVEIISFEGQCNNNLTQIEFIVASQVNNEFFTVERSTNLMDWEEVGYFDGGGTTNELITYNWSDETPIYGTKYYRISQTDINGEVRYFNPIAVECEHEMDLDITLYPNPASDKISIDLNFDYFPSEDTYLNIKSIRGEIIKSVPLHLNRGFNIIEIDCQNLPKGIYIIMINGLDIIKHEKRFIKI